MPTAPMPSRKTPRLARRIASGTALCVTCVGVAAGLPATAAASPATPAAAARQAAAAPAAAPHRLPVNRRAVHIAARQAGDPYKWGAAGPDAFDCSGLTQYVYKQLGIALPHNADAQHDTVPAVPKPDRKPGDLVFFADSGGHVYHVGIYAGHNEIWHAPEPGEVVRLQPLWTSDYSVGRPW